MNLTPSEAKRLGIDAVVSAGHSAKTKQDIAHGESVCRGLIEQVDILLKQQGHSCDKGVTNYMFDFPDTARELDASWPTFLIAVELQGFTYHAKRSAFNKDFRKAADAILKGWTVFYATEKQLRMDAAFWVTQAILNKLGESP